MLLSCLFQVLVTPVSSLVLTEPVLEKRNYKGLNRTDPGSVTNQSHLSPLFSPQSYTGQTGGSGGGGSGTAGGSGPRDEDYEIPPITPPNHPEPPPLHLMEHDSTSYLCHSLSHNGLINPYSYPELPTLMMSNMLAQESHLVSNQMPSVSGHLMQRFCNEHAGRMEPVSNLRRSTLISRGNCL